jgi:hypothetical protein
MFTDTFTENNKTEKKSNENENLNSCENNNQKESSKFKKVFIEFNSLD